MGANKNRERAQAILRRAIDEGECVFDGQYLSGMSNKLIGTLGEELAACYLEGRGYEIVERNYRCPEGEADIIAHDCDSEEVVLVEVKTRRSTAVDSYPEEAVTPSKIKRYRRIAYQFIADHFPCQSVRFDVIAVTLASKGACEIRHLYGVFDWEADQ